MNAEQVTDIPEFDEWAVRRAMRRAVWRGLLRTAAIVTAALTSLMVLVTLVSFGVSGVRGRSFFGFAYYGTRLAHPELEMKQDGNCCAAGPLFGLTNLGLANEMTLRFRPLGALNHVGTTTVVVEGDVSGEIHASIDSSDTPLIGGLARGRPTLSATAAYLQKLPEPMIASALIEFDGPLSVEAYELFFDKYVSVFEVPNRSAPVFLSDPYHEGTGIGVPVSWSSTGFGELREWAAGLSSADDAQLNRIGAPSSDVIKKAADAGMVYAFVVPRMPLSLARTLVATTGVRSVNVLDTAFDQDWQTRRG
ncbi:hypothetical protein Cme02nite_47320 [Catellatospora methionotrophica]|uniref:Uncharacterized protein n=1 Tax=Catellatospora methionotrophica TaxID=121620 RepID=A0A8J3LCW1_9ACTN|nr:hypothetical protein [Catellatospora methionotrophica]GIG16400.1 hypothetical protein Cme02nite_47320 [Catellatospora methionotrophica]